MQLLFWLSFIVVFYVYVGYPLLLALACRVAVRPVRKTYWEPSVSIVIAAHNEGERLEKKLRNCLALDYPPRKLQIVVALDGSADRSQFLVRRFTSHQVVLTRTKEHRGKATALNRALQHATGEIVVFADVRQRLDRAAIRELVANFADEQVGAVSGELILMDGMPQEANSDVGLYWRYEKTLRSMESQIHSLPGATGAIYAIRRELYRELPADTLIDDVVVPMRIVLHGKRAVFDSSAKAYDQVACCAKAEFSRKVRTLAGNYQLLMQLPQLLLPWRNPIFVQFVSHKIGRLLVPYALTTLFVSNAFILHGFYAWTFAIQAAWYACASAGYLLSNRAGTATTIDVLQERTDLAACALFDESRKAA
jgi:cellulose synthase/poly-beta-1,6-N-acetylglucosamine synthase-like glycosyltransferase